MRFALCLFSACALLCSVTHAQEPQREVTSDKIHDEDAAIATLQKSDASFTDKQFACRALKKIGTAKSVPALAALLADPIWGHQARYALETMQIPEAGQALRDAVAKTSGAPQVGVVISLGARRDAEAVDAIREAVISDDSNAALIRAAAGALGRIATPDAVALLNEGAGMVPAELKPYVAEGLLAAGDQLRAQNKSADAAAIYQNLLKSEWPEFVRLGAFRGIILAQGHESAELLLATLNGEDEKMRGAAAQMVTDFPGTVQADEYAYALDNLSPAGQAAFLRGLAGRKDPASREAVVDALKSSDASVKLAAVKALGAVGNKADVAALADLLVSQDAELAKAARSSLKNLSGKEVDAAIVARLDQAPAEEQVQLLQMLSDRMSPETVAVATKNLQSQSAPVRTAALDALAQQGTGAEAQALVAAIKNAADNDERNAAGRALGSISAHNGAEALPVILDAMKDANADAKLAMVRTLDRIGSTDALNATVALLQDPEQRISGEAARVLSNWPSPEAAPHLLTLAQGESSSLKDLGMRGYVRLAGQEQDLGKRIEMLNAVMAQAKTPQEKFIVLAAWGNVPAPQAIDTLLPYLDDEAVRNEAASALISAAANLGKQGDPAVKAKAREALQQVIAKVADQGIKDRAQAASDKIQG